MNKIELNIQFKDQRGVIVDLIEKENINAVTYITFVKGAIRGNHYHKETFQYNYVVSGKINFFTQKDQEEVKETVLTKGDLALTVPYEKHALQALEDAELIVFTRGPRGGKEYETDTFRLENPLVQ